MEGIALYLALMSLLPQPTPPRYEPAHFYYHDRQGKVCPLPTQNKVFLPQPDHCECVEIVKRKYHKVEKLTAPDSKGVLITFVNQRDMYCFFDEAVDKKFPYQPVVRWEGMDCVPINRIFVEVRPHVTENTLRKRLEDYKNFKLVSIKKVRDFVYDIEIAEPILPPNVLTLSNMLSEDSAWFAWARPDFQPLHQPIQGRMMVTQGHTNLGFQRTLEITVSIYKPSIKVKKDMLPKLGQNRFLPAPQKDEFWYDFGEPVVTESRTPDRYTLTISYPFRFLNHGNIQIQPVQIAFEDGKKQGFVWVSGISYYVNSVIAFTDINDLQPIDYNLAFTKMQKPAEPPGQVVPLTKIGTATVSGGVLLFILGMAIGLYRLQDRYSVYSATAAHKKKLWNDLYDIAKRLPKDKDKWGVMYLEAELRLMAVLGEFYGHKQPVASDDPSIKLLSVRCALNEIEKVYRPNATLDAQALSAHLFKVCSEGKHV